MPVTWTTLPIGWYAPAPILYPHEGRNAVLGSSTLLLVAERMFLVTAAHVLEEVDLTQLRLPVAFFPDSPKPVDVIGLGEAPVHFSPFENDMKRDVAVIEVTKRDVILKLQEGWKQLTLESLAAPSRAAMPYLLAGYPKDYHRSIGKHGAAQCTVFRTNRLTKAPPRAAADHRIDLMLRYDANAINGAGVTVNSPHLFGTSGGGVFMQLPDDGKSFWTPEKSIRLVGVQSSAAPDFSYFRAKRISAAIDLIRELDSDLRAEVLRHDHLENKKFKISNRPVAKETARRRPLLDFTASRTRVARG